MNNYKFSPLEIEATLEQKEMAVDYTMSFMARMEEIKNKTNGVVELDYDDICTAFLNGLITASK